MLLFYAITLLVSAFLLFLVQPLVGKMLLPYMGGTPIVWNTCMVFFQAMLLGGYLYSHLSTKWLGVRKQAYIHLGLLILTVLALATVAVAYRQPIAINKDLTPQGKEIPIFGMFLVLLLAVGLPFFTVATSAPLLQKWFANTGHPAAKDPYFLYGASNLGSVLALFAYPILLEPNFRLATQSWVWSAGFVCLAFLIGGCARLLWKSPSIAPVSAKEIARPVSSLNSSTSVSRSLPPKQPAFQKSQPAPQTPPDAPVAWMRKLRWLMLAFVPSSLMLGVTTYLATDIASLPLLWIVPLGIYLFTFIVAFSRLPNWFYTTLALITPVLVLLLIFIMGAGWMIMKDQRIIFAIHLLAFLAVALNCHCALARSRPAASHLTEFYLIMSLGGVLGGLFNALVAPLIFNDVYEYKVAIGLACLMLPTLTEMKSPAQPWQVSNAYRKLKLVSVGVTIGLAIEVAILIATLVGYERLTWWALYLALLLDALFLIPLVLAYVWFQLKNTSVERYYRGVLDFVIPGLIFLFALFLTLQRSGSDLPYWQRPIPILSEWISRECIGVEGERMFEPDKILAIIVFGIPALVCYLFVERPWRFALCVGAIQLAVIIGQYRGGQIYQGRSFFGVLRVTEEEEPRYIRDSLIRKLYHGTTLHGEEQILPPTDKPLPISYYEKSGPIGDIFREFPKPREGANLAFIGLGTGTLTAYAEPGQHVTIFEIDPLVKRLATGKVYNTETRQLENMFSFFNRCPADKQIVLGDARLMLERQQEQYDMIVVDAFSSDSIPIHLLTQQSIQLYLRKLKEPNGLIVLHISNRYLDLEPIVERLVEDAHLEARVFNDSPDARIQKAGSHWV
ncbi:MAG TPA: fused MFS/spermidine synthase, partial [Gemmataceae bacterium]|nr:fused MFS/spermidine synthase [Gemmataceae bacterium]